MFSNVFLSYVAVVVYEYFQHHHSILADFVEYIQDQLFVVETWVTWVKQLQENSFDKDQDYIF